MDRVSKGLDCVEVVLQKLNNVADIQKKAMDAAYGRVLSSVALNMLTYHDMYRQLKSEYKLTQDNIQSVNEVRDGIRQNGYVREYKIILSEIEKYADTWLRLYSNNIQGGK